MYFSKSFISIYYFKMVKMTEGRGGGCTFLEMPLGFQRVNFENTGLYLGLSCWKANPRHG